MNKEILTLKDPKQEINLKSLAKGTQLLSKARANPETFGVYDAEGFVVLTGSKEDIRYMASVTFGFFKELEEEGLKNVAQEIIDKNKT